MTKKIVDSDLFKSIGSGYVLFLATNLVALFITPFLLKHITKEEYGLYVLCVELLSWISFVNLGTAKVLGPKVAQQLSSNNQDEIIYLFNSSFWFQLGVSLLVIPIYIALVKIAGIDEIELEYITGLILLFSVAAFMNNLSGQFSEMIIATRKVHLDDKITLIVLIIRVILVLFLVPVLGLTAVFIIYFVISVVNITIKVRRVNKLYPALRVKLSFFSKKHFNELLSNGVFFTFSSLSTILVTKFDQFFLGRELGLEIVASYYVSVKLILMGEKFINVLFNNLRPHISRLHGQGKVQMINDIYIECTFLMLLIISLFIGSLIFINEWFVTLWVGPELFIGSSFNTFMVFYYALNLLTLPSRLILVSTLSFIPRLTISGFVQGVVRYFMLFIGFSSLGIDFLPISNLIALFLTSFLYQIFLMLKYSNRNKEVSRTNVLTVMSFLIGLITVQADLWFGISLIFLIIAAFLIVKNIQYDRSRLVSLFRTGV